LIGLISFRFCDSSKPTIGRLKTDFVTKVFVSSLQAVPGCPGQPGFRVSGSSIPVRNKWLLKTGILCAVIPIFPQERNIGDENMSGHHHTYTETIPPGISVYTAV
jgi:hypothetical protein